MYLLNYLYRFGNTQDVVAAPRAGDTDPKWDVQRHLRSACLDNLRAHRISEATKKVVRRNINFQCTREMCTDSSDF